MQEAEKGESGGPYNSEYEAANLRVSVDHVFTFCGSTIDVYSDRSEYRRRQGIFESHRDLEIIKGQKYAPTVDHPQTACAVKTDEPAPLIGYDVLRTDSG